MENTKILILVWVGIAHVLLQHSVEGYGTSTSGGAQRTPPPDPDHHDPDHPEDSDQWGGIGNGDHYASTTPPNEKYRETPRSDQQQKNRKPEKNLFSRQAYTEKYGFPEGCTNSKNFQADCNFYVEITKERNDPDVLHFELGGHLQGPDGWVGVGLSNDSIMGQDHIVNCIKLSDGSNPTYYHSWSTGRTPPRRLQPDTRIIQMESTYPKYENGLLTCKFKRPLKTFVEFEGEKFPFDLIYGEHHILIAMGSLNHVRSDEVGYHGQLRYATPKPMGYTEPKKSGGYSGQQSLSHNPAVFLVFLMILKLV